MNTHFCCAISDAGVRRGEYCRYGISYRDLETMMTERGVKVDHSTIYRWVQHYELEKRMRWQWRQAASGSWRGRSQDHPI